MTTAPLSLVLLPGLACDASLFEQQIPALRAAGHTVQVSDVATREATLPAMARRLVAELPEAAHGPVVLIGSSMGGMLALHVAHLAPERVKAMALLSTTAQPDSPALIALRTGAIGDFLAGRAAQVLQANAAFAFHPDHARDLTQVGHYVQQILRAGAPQLVAQNRAVMAREDMRPWLGAMAMPVLVACGDRDLLTPLALSQEIAAALPAARLEVVAQAGHLLTWEQPEAVNRLLLDWLSSLR